MTLASFYHVFDPRRARTAYL